jgi:hypothetical protein
LDSKQDTTIHFYQALGKLFYAVACADQCVREEELIILKDVLDKEWNNVKGFNANAHDTVVRIFEWLHNDSEYDAEICYNSFINFKKANEAMFDDQLKSLILKTASKITSSFNNQNKSELIMLAKLNLEFKKE